MLASLKIMCCSAGRKLIQNKPPWHVQTFCQLKLSLCWECFPCWKWERGALCGGRWRSLWSATCESNGRRGPTGGLLHLSPCPHRSCLLSDFFLKWVPPSLGLVLAGLAPCLVQRISCQGSCAAWRHAPMHGGNRAVLSSSGCSLRGALCVQ